MGASILSPGATPEPIVQILFVSKSICEKFVAWAHTLHESQVEAELDRILLFSSSQEKHAVLKEKFQEAATVVKMYAQNSMATAQAKVKAEVAAKVKTKAKAKAKVEVEIGNSNTRSVRGSLDTSKAHRWSSKRMNGHEVERHGTFFFRRGIFSWDVLTHEISQTNRFRVSCLHFYFHLSVKYSVIIYLTIVHPQIHKF